MLDRFQNLIGYAQDTTHFVYNNLQSAFTALQSALPSAYQSHFAMYDLGFYHHHTSYEGGIPDVMQQAIDGLATSYYLGFNRWNELFQDKVLTATMVDRLIHNAILINMTGQSYRLKSHDKFS